MTNEVLVKTGTSFVWKATAGDASMVMASLADTEACQGSKLDLGATRAARWSVLVENNLDSAPTAGLTLEYWWSSSPSAVAGTQNTGAASGVAGAYTGSAGGTVAETKLQLTYIGTLVLTPDADTVVQVAEFVFYPLQRYGMPILVNLSGQALEGDDDSHQITLTPIIDEVQDAP